MGAGELQEWAYYLSIEPPAEERTVHQLASLSSVYVNAKTAKGKRTNFTDFLLQYEPKERPHRSDVKAALKAQITEGE